MPYKIEQLRQHMASFAAMLRRVSPEQKRLLAPEFINIVDVWSSSTAAGESKMIVMPLVMDKDELLGHSKSMVRIATLPPCKNNGCKDCKSTKQVRCSVCQLLGLPHSQTRCQYIQGFSEAARMCGHHKLSIHDSHLEVKNVYAGRIFFEPSDDKALSRPAIVKYPGVMIQYESENSVLVLCCSEHHYNRLCAQLKLPEVEAKYGKVSNVAITLQAVILSSCTSPANTCKRNHKRGSVVLSLSRTDVSRCGSCKQKLDNRHQNQPEIQHACDYIVNYLRREDEKMDDAFTRYIYQWLYVLADCWLDAGSALQGEPLMKAVCALLESQGVCQHATSREHLATTLARVMEANEELRPSTEAKFVPLVQQLRQLWSEKRHCGRPVRFRTFARVMFMFVITLRQKGQATWQSADKIKQIAAMAL